MSVQPKRRWRDYRTAAGRRLIKEFIDRFSDVDAAAVVAAMKDVQEAGLNAARHLPTREKLGLSQTVVAARMGTSQSAVARLEAGEIDAKLSTVERFAAALGQKVEWRVAKVR